MDRWRGRTALVTGASVGIGRNIVIDLLKHGLNVVACARRVDAVEAIKNEIDTESGAGELMAVKCDLTKEEEILAMFEQIKASKFAGVDVCVNNAGLGIMSQLKDVKTEDLQTMLSLNVLALSLCTREAIKSMKERNVDDGHIVHISSVLGHTVYAGLSFYSATKWAVRALTEGLRTELLAEKSGIRVTQISPGVVKTEFAKIMLGNEDSANGFYESSNFLTGYDVSSSVIHVLSAPKHVQIHDVIMWPVAKPE